MANEEQTEEQELRDYITISAAKLVSELARDEINIEVSVDSHNSYRSRFAYGVNLPVLSLTFIATNRNTGAKSHNFDVVVDKRGVDRAVQVAKRTIVNTILPAAARAEIPNDTEQVSNAPVVEESTYSQVTINGVPVSFSRSSYSLPQDPDDMLNREIQMAGHISSLVNEVNNTRRRFFNEIARFGVGLENGGSDLLNSLAVISGHLGISSDELSKRIGL